MLSEKRKKDYQRSCLKKGFSKKKEKFLPKTGKMPLLSEPTPQQVKSQCAIFNVRQAVIQL